jgi:hypothetical protein
MIREESPWAKAADSLPGEVPFLGLLTGFIFHPADRVCHPDTGSVVLRLVKEASVSESRYRIEKFKAMRPEGSPVDPQRVDARAVGAPPRVTSPPDHAAGGEAP